MFSFYLESYVPLNSDCLVYNGEAKMHVKVSERSHPKPTLRARRSQLFDFFLCTEKVLENS